MAARSVRKAMDADEDLKRLVNLRDLMLNNGDSSWAVPVIKVLNDVQSIKIDSLLHVLKFISNAIYLDTETENAWALLEKAIGALQYQYNSEASQWITANDFPTLEQGRVLSLDPEFTIDALGKSYFSLKDIQMSWLQNSGSAASKADMQNVISEAKMRKWGLVKDNLDILLQRFLKGEAFSEVVQHIVRALEAIEVLKPSPDL